MDKTFCVWIKVSGSGYLLRFNDMVMDCTARTDPPGRLYPAHEFVLQGHNTLSVTPVWQAADLNHESSPIRPRKLMSQPAQIEVKLMMVKDRGAGVLVEPQVIQAWSQTVPAGDLRLGAAALKVSVDLPFTFPKWRWSDLAVGTQALSTVHERVRERMEQMCRWILDGQEEPFLRQFNVRVDEYAKAYAQEVGDAVNRFKSQFSLREGRLTLAECSLELDQMMLLPCRRESVVYPINAKGEPFLQLQHVKSGHRIRLPLHLAALGEEVYVVR